MQHNRKVSIVHPGLSQDVSREDVEVEAGGDGEMSHARENRVDQSRMLEHRVTRPATAKQIDG